MRSSIVPLSFHSQLHLLQVYFKWGIIKYVCHTHGQLFHELMDCESEFPFSLFIYTYIYHKLTLIEDIIIWKGINKSLTLTRSLHLPPWPHVASPLTHHHPPPYPISQVRDLGRKTWTVVVSLWTINTHYQVGSLRGEQITVKAFCIVNFIILFDRFSNTEDCVNILWKK